MSTQIDFSLVRYSPIEGTHFFYDARYPSTVQFLLSGRWEAWDVGWVKCKSQDAEIRRIAEEAEARLINDPESGYTAWPAPPPPGPPGAQIDKQASPAATRDRSPSAQTSDQAWTEPTQNARPSASASPQLYGSSPPSVGQSILDPSLYYDQPSSSSCQTTQGSSKGKEPAHSVPTNAIDPSIASAQQQPQSAPDPSIQPAPPTGVVLSRDRETKILLSIDGDGIRGLSALLLIESLVNAICVEIGQRLDCHQIFDLTGGSSLGGIIAILLCRLQMQAHRARKAYKEIARHVFLNKRDFFMSLDPQAPMPNGDGEGLEAEIRTVIEQELGSQDETFFDGRENSGDVFVVSTHIEIGANKAALMRSYQTRRITGPELDANMSIVQAMRATAIAPRYMLPQPGTNQRLVIEPGLVDHGTSKNNPVRDILYECRKLFRYANDMMIIVSIGSGLGMDRFNEIPEMANSVDDRSAEARLWAEKFEADHRALMERGWMKYYRFNVPGLDDVPLEEWCHEDEIKEKTSAYLAQPEVSQMFYACVDAITTLLLGPQPRQ